METDEPRKALHDESTSVRAAAARDLSLIGTFDDLDDLVEMAIDADSSALRLYAAAAVADILHRYRGLRDHPTLSRSQRKKVHAWARSFDPGRNPGLLMILSAVSDDESLKRLERMLRDPRNTVRSGAVMALRRRAISAAAQGDQGVRDTVYRALRDKRTPADVQLDLIRLVGEIGWSGLRREVRRAASSGRMHGEAAEEAMERLDARQDPSTWAGAWRDTGLDVFEVGDESDDPNWRLIADGRLSEGGAPRAFTVDEGLGQVEGDDQPVRMVWAAPIGAADERTRVLQQGDRCWWRLEDKALAKAVDKYHEGLGTEAGPLLEALDDWLSEVDGKTAPRVRAIVALETGRSEHALEILEELTDVKKPRKDLFWWKGRVLADLGRTDEAKQALETFLDRAGTRAQYRPEAEALLEDL